MEQRRNQCRRKDFFKALAIHASIELAATPKYVVINGEFLPWNEGKVHLTTHGLMYGTMVFEGIWGYVNGDKTNVYLFRLREQLE